MAQRWPGARFGDLAAAKNGCFNGAKMFQASVAGMQALHPKALQTTSTASREADSVLHLSIDSLESLDIIGIALTERWPTPRSILARPRKIATFNMCPSS